MVGRHAYRQRASAPGTSLYHFARGDVGVVKADRRGCRGASRRRTVSARHSAPPRRCRASAAEERSQRRRKSYANGRPTDRDSASIRKARQPRSAPARASRAREFSQEIDFHRRGSRGHAPARRGVRGARGRKTPAGVVADVGSENPLRPERLPRLRPMRRRSVSSRATSSARSVEIAEPSVVADRPVDEPTSTAIYKILIRPGAARS